MQSERPRNDALAELAALLQALRAQHKTNNSQLEARTGFKRQQISRAMLGREIPSPELTDALEVTLQGGGNIRRLREQALREKRLRALGLDPRMTTEEPMDATRRQTFALAAAGLVAAEIYREWTAAGPDALTLDEIDDAISRHAVAFTTTPHRELAPDVWVTWQSAHTHLRAGGRAKPQARLTVAAGYASYMLSRLAFNLGDGVAARRFIRLAEDHASQVDDPVLSGSVAEMMTTLAFYGRRYAEAAHIAERAAQNADPYLKARMHAYWARVLAAIGDDVGARAALAKMRESIVEASPQPGSSPFGPATADMFHAGVLARIGAGTEAEPIARRAVDDFDGGRATGFEDHGHALLALAAALTNRERPVIDEAATLASRVIDMLDAQPTSSVSAKISEVATAFTDHRIKAVRDFWDHWHARPRLELTGAHL